MSDEYQSERNFWGNCTNTAWEEAKQYVYADCMGVPVRHWSFEPEGRRILDIGGGPVSMLLKVRGLHQGKVIDPIVYPAWTRERYNLARISVQTTPAEDMEEFGWDEVWVYNCLQHVIDPAEIMRRALKSARVLRICEWIDQPPFEGHPHMLTEAGLDSWIGQKGQVSDLTGRLGYQSRWYHERFDLA